MGLGGYGRVMGTAKCMSWVFCDNLLKPCLLLTGHRQTLILTLVSENKVTRKVMGLGSVGALSLEDCWKQRARKEKSGHYWLDASTGRRFPRREPHPSSLTSLARKHLCLVVPGSENLCSRYFFWGRGPSLSPSPGVLSLFSALVFRKKRRGP